MNRRQLLKSVAMIAASGSALWPALSRAANMQGMSMKDMKMGGGMIGASERITELPIGQPLPELVKLANTSNLSAL